MKKNEYGRLEMSPLPPVEKAKIVIVGEFPNATELREGRYFISDGADALNGTLKRCGIDLNDCYYTVAVPYLMNKKNKVIPAERQPKERQRLLDEIKESGATTVVPLGTLATSLLMNVKSITITKVLGNVLTCPDLPGVTIIPNYHPALLLHAPGNYKVFHSVMETVARCYKGAGRDPGVTKWRWIENLEGLHKLTEIIRLLPYVAADIETSGLDTKTAEIWTIGVAVSKNEVYVIPHEVVQECSQGIKNLFAAPCKWIWHHGKFDTKLLHWKGFRTARHDEDTIYLHYCLNETSGTHGLGQCATVFLGADEYKSKMNSEFAVLTTLEAYQKSKEDLGERVATDADYTFQLYEVFKPQIEASADWKNLYNNILMPGANFLRKVEMRGMKVDVPYLEQRVPYYEEEIVKVTREVQDAAAQYWNPEEYKEQTGAKTASDLFKPTSVKQLAWLVYDRLGLKHTVRGAKKRATGAEILPTIPNPPEFILKILELRKVKKEYSTYVQSYLKCKDENDIVHPTFNLHITATGRLSCTDPKLEHWGR